MRLSARRTMPLQSMPFLSVIIPAYNEENNIKGAIQDVLNDVAVVVPDLEVIVVDDGSRDRTAELASEIARRDGRVRVLTQFNRGHGPALVHGLAEATGEWVFLIDSDRQVSLKNFALHWVMTADHDAILGLRRPRRDPLHRLLISFAMRVLLRARLGIHAGDAGAPYKLVKRQVWQDACKMMRDGCWIPSVLLAAHVLRRRDIVAREVPVEHRRRSHGPSTLNLGRLARFCREGAIDVAFYRACMCWPPHQTPPQ